MRKLDRLIIAEPSPDVAEHIAGETTHLAKERLIATTGGEALGLVGTHKPAMCLLSLEIARPEATEIAPQLLAVHPKLFIVATFRELALPLMGRLEKVGIEDFIPQPIDYTELFRAASDHFGMPFRRHARYPITLEVFRMDGVLIGKTRDISAGGLMMDCIHPAQAEQSLLVDIALTDETKVRVRCQIIAAEGQPPIAMTARGQFQNLRGDEYRKLMGFLAELREGYQAEG